MKFRHVVSLLLLWSIPALAFKVKDGEAILDSLDDYQLCQSRDSSGAFCHDALKRWVAAHPADAFRAGKMTRRTMNSWAAMSFFNQAFESKSGDCKDEDVVLAIASALGQPDSQMPEYQAAAKWGFGQCFEQVKATLVEQATVGSDLFKNVCGRLVEKGLLSGLKAKKCKESGK
jgi:hypothetical protein